MPPQFLLALALAALPLSIDGRQVESLDRGLVLLRLEDGSVVVSWRLLATDSPETAFVLERRDAEGQVHTLGTGPLRDATWWHDEHAPRGQTARYRLRLASGSAVDAPGPLAESTVATAPCPYLEIPLQTLAGHTPNDASVGDLDGDGELEIIIKQEQRPRDNSQSGPTGQTKLEAYTLQGRLLWRIDLGPNIREGAHYTPFIVFDLDGDGRSELACRTADGTIDGQGQVVGDAQANHRDERGFVLSGPEFLSIFDGLTGAAVATVPYLPPRGEVTAWGDDYGNRSDRFLAGVAYLDGQRPSLIMCRGYYNRTVLAAWNWRDQKLCQLWTFDSDSGFPTYRGQGNHGLSVGDVDGDGRDEILYGSCAIDDDGAGLYSNGLGHGDAMHLGDLDPDRPGLEVFGIHERPRHPFGAEMHDAATGEVLWAKPSRDVGRGLAADIDPRHPGAECWASGNGLTGLWTASGELASPRKPRSCNFAAWWDGDVQRELLDRTSVSKWSWDEQRDLTLLEAPGCASNNSTKATPALCADILGDWREEILWRNEDNRALRIYSSTMPTTIRVPTLLHDPVYRLSVAWQNVGYNQPTQVSHGLRDQPLKAQSRD